PPHPPNSPLFPYTTLFRSAIARRNPSPQQPGDIDREITPDSVIRPAGTRRKAQTRSITAISAEDYGARQDGAAIVAGNSWLYRGDRKSTRLNSSHVSISYA